MDFIILGENLMVQMQSFQYTGSQSTWREGKWAVICDAYLPL